MKLLGAVVLLVLGVLPGVVLDPLHAGNAGDTVAGVALLGVAVLILVASLRGEASRWYRAASSVVAAGAASLWLLWSAASAVAWVLGG